MIMVRRRTKTCREGYKEKGKGEKNRREREREEKRREGGRHVRILVVELLVNKNNY